MMQSMWRGVAEGCALRGQCELYMHVYFLKVPLQGLENQVSTASSVAKPSSVTSTDLSEILVLPKITLDSKRKENQH